MTEQKKIIELNGIKLEADLRNAKVIETYKVGDNIKVLDKSYSETKIHTGTIVDFADFGDTQAVIVAVYKEADFWNPPTVSFVTVTEDNDKYSIAPIIADELRLSKDTIVERFNQEIAKHQREIDDLKLKKEMFIKYFGKGRE